MTPTPWGHSLYLNGRPFGSAASLADATTTPHARCDAAAFDVVASSTTNAGFVAMPQRPRRLRVLATITDPPGVRRILEHLGARLVFECPPGQDEHIDLSLSSKADPDLRVNLYWYRSPGRMEQIVWDSAPPPP